jgi:hypothetical protein
MTPDLNDMGSVRRRLLEKACLRNRAFKTPPDIAKGSKAKLS